MAVVDIKNGNHHVLSHETVLRRHSGAIRFRIE
jgi:hypothetical protein